MSPHELPLKSYSLREKQQLLIHSTLLGGGGGGGGGGGVIIPLIGYDHIDILITQHSLPFTVNYCVNKLTPSNQIYKKS